IPCRTQPPNEAPAPASSLFHLLSPAQAGGSRSQTGVRRLLVHTGFEMWSSPERLRTTEHSTNGSRAASDAAAPYPPSGSTYGAWRTCLSTIPAAAQASIPVDQRQRQAYSTSQVFAVSRSGSRQQTTRPIRISTLRRLAHFWTIPQGRSSHERDPQSYGAW